MEFTLFKSECPPPPPKATDYTIVWGIVAASLGFILKDWIQSYLFEPRNRYQALRREIAESLIRYSLTYRYPHLEVVGIIIEMNTSGFWQAKCALRRLKGCGTTVGSASQESPRWMPCRCR